MTKRMIVIASGTALLLAAAVVAVAVLRSYRQPMVLPEVQTMPMTSEVHVKAVERNSEPVAEGEVAAASGAVAIVCGEDAATADRYEARNDALRSIARRRDLPEEDVAALAAYLRAQDDNMRSERVAALKNDIMNLLRSQEPPPKGLADELIGMFYGGNHPSAVLDYCIQHLGAMQDELNDALRGRVRKMFVEAARRTSQSYAGTALYSLAEDKLATAAQEGELKRLTLALCKPGVNNVARIAAIQLAGQRGYTEALPVLRDTLSGEKRDAVLDTVCIGTIGLLGDESDLPFLSRFTSDSRRSTAAEAAVRRIKERDSAKQSQR